MSDRGLPASAIPLATRELAEVLLERLEAASGEWTVELAATNGRLQRVYRHHKLGPKALERLDAAPPLPQS